MGEETWREGCSAAERKREGPVRCVCFQAKFLLGDL